MWLLRAVIMFQKATKSSKWFNPWVSPANKTPIPLATLSVIAKMHFFKQSFVCLFSQEFIGLAPKGQDESGVDAFLSTFLSSSSPVCESLEYFIWLSALETLTEITTSNEIWHIQSRTATGPFFFSCHNIPLCMNSQLGALLFVS